MPITETIETTEKVLFTAMPMAKILEIQAPKKIAGFYIDIRNADGVGMPLSLMEDGIKKEVLVSFAEIKAVQSIAEQANSPEALDTQNGVYTHSGKIALYDADQNQLAELGLGKETSGTAEDPRSQISMRDIGDQLWVHNTAIEKLDKKNPDKKNEWAKFDAIRDQVRKALKGLPITDDLSPEQKEAFELYNKNCELVKSHTNSWRNQRAVTPANQQAPATTGVVSPTTMSAVGNALAG